MPNMIIEQMRQELMASEYVPTEVKKIRSLNRFSKSFDKKSKEEFYLSNPFNTAGPAVGMVPGARPGAPVPPASGTNIARYRQDSIDSATKKGLGFRPKALITDGEEVERYIYDKDNRELTAFINAWQANNTVIDKVTGTTRVKGINALRAVKELCAQTGQNPKDFAQTDASGNRLTETKKPSVKGFVITFPLTESGSETTEIIKKQDLMDAILSKGGFALAGTYDETLLNAEKLEIPVALMVTPTKRKSKDHAGETITSSLRISGQTATNRKKTLFPDKNNVGLYDLFARFPFDKFQVSRIVPLKLYETEMDGTKRVAKLDVSPEKKLAQYQSYTNELNAGAEGAEIMEKLGLSASKLHAAFSRKTQTGLETEADLVSLINKSFNSVDAGPDVQKYINLIQ